MLNVIQYATLHVECHATCNRGYRMLLVLKRLLLLLLHCWGARLCLPAGMGGRAQEEDGRRQRRPQTSPRPGAENGMYVPFVYSRA